MAQPPDSGRRFTQQEFALILRKAAELQESKIIPARRDGFILSEMEQIAAEAGIAMEHVHEAISQIDLPRLSRSERFLGGTATFRVEQSVAAKMSEPALQLIVDEARRAIGKQGEVRYVLDALEWGILG
ncbi:MAG: hypothetical protein ACREMA_04840 [Longimicrobiales bacterium]